LFDQALEAAPTLGPAARAAFGEHIVSVHFDSSFGVFALLVVFVVR
jgi:hypothetical protein